MTYIDDADVVYNLQRWFRKNRIDSSPNDDRIWIEVFESWLRDQGCEIERSHDRVLRNSLGIASGYDRLRFEHERDAVLFQLRWS